MKLWLVHLFFARKSKESQSIVANRALTQTGRPSPPLPHKGCCRRTLAPADQAETGRKAFAALQANIVLHRRNHAAATRPRRSSGTVSALALDKAARNWGSFGRQSAPNLCRQNHQTGSAALAGELRVCPLFRSPCCCQRHLLLQQCQVVQCHLF